MEYQLQRENPIAVFDSGVGGISVLRELIRIMPEEDFIYFGDSKNAPYGTKEKEKVRELTIGCARKLFDQGGKRSCGCLQYSHQCCCPETARDVSVYSDCRD